ncbi:MAG TPA: 6-hydroxymethylpterin diphosphokinase MptE-like protein [Thermoplasmata archaeon]|nr:6-hydroxymethylpterin diphosphokinase MptE-like protein [Thermoplasmata archaeon]
MRYAAWAPWYERLRTEFGFPWSREEGAARRLVELLPPAARARALERVAERLRGRDTIVVGDAPGVDPPPLWRLPATEPEPALVAADGATAALVRAGLVPSVITTDLDGSVPAEISANRHGSLVVVHAHGDNVPALEEWVPAFDGALAGSWAGPPREGLLDVGGFTDGDRAAYLADEVGARRILLWGFAFDRVVEADPARAARKLAKLRWANALLAVLARDGTTPVLLWGSDGSMVPYPAGTAGPTTR